MIHMTCVLKMIKTHKNTSKIFFCLSSRLGTGQHIVADLLHDGLISGFHGFANLVTASGEH